jgi:autotransporter-associated beta strand protein
LDGASPSVAGITLNSGGASGTPGPGYTISQGTGGVLQLANGGTSASITVSSGSQAISAPLALDSNLTVSPAAGSQLTISGGIDGAGQSLLVNDWGTVVLSGAANYTGGTTVSAGTLIVSNSSAIAAGTSLTVGADAASLFNSSPSTASDDATTSSAEMPAVASSGTSLAMSDAALVATSSNTSATTAAPVATIPALPLGPQTSEPTKSVPAIALRAPVADRIVWSSIAKSAAGDLAWLGQAANGSDNSDQHHKKDAAILALEAVFAHYFA